MIALTFFLLGTILLFWCLSKLQAPLTHQFTLLLLVLAMGLRYNVGIDYPTYEEIYNKHSDNNSRRLCRRTGGMVRDT